MENIEICNIEISRHLIFFSYLSSQWSPSFSANGAFCDVILLSKKILTMNQEWKCLQKAHGQFAAERVNFSSLWQNNILFPTTALGFEQSVGKPLVDCTKPKTSTSCLVLFSCLESTFLPRCCFALYHCCGGVPNASWSRFRSFYKFQQKNTLFSRLGTKLAGCTLLQ